MPVFMLRNCILDELVAAAAGEFDPASVRSVALRSDQILLQSGDTLKSVYFPQTALISTIVEMGSDESIDGILVGNEGLFGAAAAFAVEAAVFTSVVQRAGSCWLMPASELRRLVHENKEVAAILFRYQHFLLAQAQQLAACLIKHNVRERFCTYLLRVMDDDGEARLIQERLARTLGVQRTSISLVAGGLQSDGIIRYQRGRIEALDLDGLRTGACGCYAIIEEFKRKLLETAPPPAILASLS